MPAQAPASIAGQAGVCSVHRTLAVRTGGPLELYDLTPQLEEFVVESPIEDGILLVQSLHTTAGLLMNEWETGFKRDLARVANGLVPPGGAYRHDDMSLRWENLCPDDEDHPNGHSHIQAAMIGTPSLTLGARNGRLVIGRWQRVCLVEFDRSRSRRVALQLLGGASACRS
jgi:secondary thiamine-phosphate synthase enzyme